MDTKKTITTALLLAGSILAGATAVAQSPAPAKVQFVDRAYTYAPGNDSIRVFFNMLDDSGKRISDMTTEQFSQMANFFEDGQQIKNAQVSHLSGGVRIPREFTFSILLDKSIPEQGKRQILSSMRQFVDMAPDSCVYVSFYGDEVSNTVPVNSSNFSQIEQEYLTPSQGKYFYSGVHSKLAEFSKTDPGFMGDVRASSYAANPAVADRAAANPGKNFLMVFAEGSQRPDDEMLDFISLSDYQAGNLKTLPKVYAFYYTADGQDNNIELTLQGLAEPRDAEGNMARTLTGSVMSSANMNDVLTSFQTVIEDATYDYQLLYMAGDRRAYTGAVNYSAKWGNLELGDGTLTIGSAERPWPVRAQSATSFIVELLVALLVTLLTMFFFFIVLKVLVPWIQSLNFRRKYYRKYVPEENVNRRICHYCKQDIRPGQVIVTKCSHWMHKHCWEENNYRCAEFGQNCSTGIQSHVDWKTLFSWNSIKDCSQTFAGILAGLISWIIYEICGRGGFTGLSEWIVGLVFKGDNAGSTLVQDCVMKTSSFLMIGMLLGFFISLVFRYKDEVRDKDWRVWLKIVGLSLLTSAIGMLAFAIGADLFCLIVSASDMAYIPWYCSLPAYVLFSISVSLALTIKSTIPLKSAILGGLLSAVIGFLVLYFTRFTSARYEWINMLLDFIIYGGGLGASLVTVRLLAEKYFLVIQNGVKAGLKIPIHKWMNATGGGNKVSIGMTGECEIQMNWEKSNKVAKQHAQLFIDHERNLPVIKPLATGVVYNSRAELPVNRMSVLSNGDTFKIGDTIFKYEEA